MQIIVGLGNPGNRYELSRHNAGFLVLDNLRQVLECSEFSEKKKLHSQICKLPSAVFVKPQTYMNESGSAVQAVLNFFNTGSVSDAGYKNLFVIHDDLDIPLGSYKIQYGVGPKGHNGLLSIYQHLKTENFWHVRVGVDSRDGDRTIPPQTYVLDQFTPQQLDTFKGVVQKIVTELVQKIQ